MDDLELETKKMEVIKRGKEVFGSFSEFAYWVLNHNYTHLYRTQDGLDQLEEMLIQLDEGYCL